MSQHERDNLARQQAQMLGGIFAARTPAGMTPGQLAHAAEVLRGKRRREAAVAAPQLAEALGEKFNERFDYYAWQVGYPKGGPVADAAAFGGHLERQGLLPEGAWFEHMMLKALSGTRWQMRAMKGNVVVMIRAWRQVRVFRFF